MADLHPVKLESFQIAEQVNVDPKGFTRPVDQFSIQRGALYMARPADHPRFHYLESWLYPSLDIRVTWFHFREQARKDVPTQEMYVDIATVDNSDPDNWTTRDLYIDVVTHRGGRLEVLDLDELGLALAAGHIDAEEGNRALHATQQLLDGINTHGNLHSWLSRHDYPLAWHQDIPRESDHPPKP